MMNFEEKDGEFLGTWFKSLDALITADILVALTQRAAEKEKKRKEKEKKNRTHGSKDTNEIMAISYHMVIVVNRNESSLIESHGFVIFAQPQHPTWLYHHLPFSLTLNRNCILFMIMKEYIGKKNKLILAKRTRFNMDPLLMQYQMFKLYGL